jgi:ribosome biogenesis protein BRX1
MRTLIIRDYDGMRLVACTNDVHLFIESATCNLTFCHSLLFISSQIWVRNYQILEEHASTALEAQKVKKITGDTISTSLVEIGPRFVLNPVRIFRGSFGGQTLFQNPDFVSPNEVRALERRQKGTTYANRKESQTKRKERMDKIIVPQDPLANVFR